MGQQFYVIRRNPAPGTPAVEAKQKRDRAKGRLVEEPTAATEVASDVAEPPRPQQRQQPKRQSKQQRKRSGGRPSGGKQNPGKQQPDDGENEGKSA
jgi:YidC/Oxa1 family membrane protein insertase